MQAWNLKHSILGCRILTRFAAEKGIALDVCLQDTGITAELLADPVAEIDPRQELTLIRNVLRAAGHPPGIGIEVGQRYRLSSFGMWGFALYISSTPRSFISMCLKYGGLAGFFATGHGRTAGPELHLIYDDGEVPPDVRQYLVERNLILLTNLFREVYPAVAMVKEVRFNFPAPSYRQALQNALGVPVKFDSSGKTAVIVDEALIDQPRGHGDDLTPRLLEEQCRALLEQRRERPTTASRVRDIIRRQPREVPDVKTIASELCMHPRTLRRHLMEAGTSYRELVKEARESLALELMASTNLSIAEIADRLGYSESASFLHAFRRWNGRRPSEIRSELAAQQAAARVPLKSTMALDEKC